MHFGPNTRSQRTFLKFSFHRTALYIGYSRNIAFIGNANVVRALERRILEIHLCSSTIAAYVHSDKYTDII